MFQSFQDDSASHRDVAERVARLRAELDRLGLDAFLVPRGDEHRGEYVAPCAERLAWLTGFTGSAGSAVIAKSGAALLVDGRYTVQAKAQTPRKLFDQLPIPGSSAEGWLIEHLKRTPGGVIGFDPWLHSVAEIERAGRRLEAAGLRLKPVARNPIDRIWGQDRPAAPTNPVIVHPLSRAGVSAADKIAAVQSQLAEADQGAMVITAPDSICWLLNIRGSDVAHNPVVLCYAVVPAKGKVALIVEKSKLDEKARAHLKPIAQIHSRKAFAKVLKSMAVSHPPIRIDAETCPVWIARQIGRKSAIARGRDLCVQAKAVKNATEIRGMRAAHRRDAIAVCRFLAWLDREAANGTIDEIAAVRQLEALRTETGKLREISFDTISGSGPNGAIVHYRVTEKTNRALGRGELYLVDSGAQYPDGTTDITRTIAIGRPTEEMRDRFTRVLKGHIAIATARFPEGTRGVDLDAFARRALWDAGLDYDHGTGHGVGSYLSVHEGPQSISRRGMVALEPGMIVSNEPGFYREGAYGIRIENLVLVQRANKPAGGERAMLSFETLTFAPIDRRLTVPDLLSTAERNWLNAYHADVNALVGPLLDSGERQWLARACQPV